MNKAISLLIVACLSTPTAFAQVDWRFGFEDTWSGLAGLLNAEQSETLLNKMSTVVAAQDAGGDVNFPALYGGWTGMQPSEGGPIAFDRSDDAVRLLQAHGFSMLWNLRINARWSSQGNADCYGDGDCAPDAAHEDDLYDFIYALVERYDGDGFMDMGYETPEDPSDDLQIPIRFYLMTGEIEFAGAYPPSEPGYGDAAKNHFWTDTIDDLLRTHRIVYQALHDADPTGNTSLVSSGGVLWDLYDDFPDYPQIEGPTVQARLEGDNNHGAQYTESFGRLKTMLASFGDDSDGVEADYVGWHPHMPWREIDQAFRLIHTYAGDMPIYVDDMWCNIFLADREDAPGGTLFTGGGQAIEGDFPNALVPTYTALRNGVIGNNAQVVDWYYAHHARTMVKAFASVFGEGAERASISGDFDFAPVRLSTVGFINIMGTPGEDFFEKPGYYTYKLLVEKLHDFVSVEEIDVSDDPLTRVYAFERAGRGPVYVMWSDAGEPPPGLDYGIATGETVTLRAVDGADAVTVTHPVTARGQTEPYVETRATDDGTMAIQLGYEPIFVEGDRLVVTGTGEEDGFLASFALYPPFPEPFSDATTITYDLPDARSVTMKIFDVTGREVATVVDGPQTPGRHRVTWAAIGVPPGVYFIRIEAGNVTGTAAVTRIR